MSPTEWAGFAAGITAVLVAFFGGLRYLIKGKNSNGVYRVSAAKLVEVSLVQAAAFSSAAVTSVAASNAEAESTETKT